jgi:hypothetical protein
MIISSETGKKTCRNNPTSISEKFSKQEHRDLPQPGKRHLCKPLR